MSPETAAVMDAEEIAGREVPVPSAPEEPVALVAPQAHQAHQAPGPSRGQREKTVMVSARHFTMCLNSRSYPRYEAHMASIGERCRLGRSHHSKSAYWQLRVIANPNPSMRALMMTRFWPAR